MLLGLFFGMHLMLLSNAFSVVSFAAQRKYAADSRLLYSRGENSICSYDYLDSIRDEIDELRISLYEADTDDVSVSGIREKIQELEKKDPEFMYAAISDQLLKSPDDERLLKEAEYYRKQLPHFNLGGLWIGRYAEKGVYDFIEISYEGNKLTAIKKTGEGRSIPVGEVTFRADLSPSCYSSEASSECLLPMVLPDEIVSRWHNKKLARFPGEGQVASEGFTDSEWVQGELIMVDKNSFVFIWEPFDHQIFFVRPPKHLWNEDLFGPYPEAEFAL